MFFGGTPPQPPTIPGDRIVHSLPKQNIGVKYEKLIVSLLIANAKIINKINTIQNINNSLNSLFDKIKRDFPNKFFENINGYAISYNKEKPWYVNYNSYNNTGSWYNCVGPEKDSVCYFKYINKTTSDGNNYQKKYDTGYYNHYSIIFTKGYKSLLKFDDQGFPFTDPVSISTIKSNEIIPIATIVEDKN